MKNYNWKDIKSYEDACKALQISVFKENKIFVFFKKLFNLNDTPDEIAYKKLKVIIKAINQGWKPNYKDSNQKKWYPYFDLSSFFRFDNASYDYYGVYTDAAVRLCLETQEKAEYMGKKFTKLYEEYLT
jgi:hypothetical protein